MKLGDLPHTKAEEADNERLLGTDWRNATHADVLDALAGVKAGVDQLEAEGRDLGLGIDAERARLGH